MINFNNATNNVIDARSEQTNSDSDYDKPKCVHGITSSRIDCMVFDNQENKVNPKIGIRCLNKKPHNSKISLKYGLSGVSIIFPIL